MKFGSCLTGHHDKCRRKVQKFYFGPVRKGRKSQEALIFLDEYDICDCKCHEGKEEA